jgi:prevent-host-death family protein
MDSYTLTQARASLGDVINEVRHGRKPVQITDHGKAVAEIVPSGTLEYLYKLEDELALIEANAIKAASTGELIPHAEVMARLGLLPNGRPQ